MKMMTEVDLYGSYGGCMTRLWYTYDEAMVDHDEVIVDV